MPRSEAGRRYLSQVALPATIPTSTIALMTQINIDAYLVDCLLPDLVGHNRRLSSFVVYLYLYRHASQDANWSVRISHQSIATATGLSRAAQPLWHTFRPAKSSRRHARTPPQFRSTACNGRGCVEPRRKANPVLGTKAQESPPIPGRVRAIGFGFPGARRSSTDLPLAPSVGRLHSKPNRFSLRKLVSISARSQPQPPEPPT